MSAPRSGRQKLTPVENPPNFPWDFSNQLPHVRKQRLASGELVPIDKHNVASLAPLSANPRIAILDASTGIPWLELSGLPKFKNISIPSSGHRPVPHTVAERMFFDSSSGKFALLDTKKTRIHFCNFDASSHAKDIPRLRGTTVHPVSGDTPSISQRFDRPKLITSFSVRENSHGSNVDSTGAVRTTKPTHGGRNPSRKVEVICELTNGRKLATVHSFNWTSAK